ncbi:MAG: panthothenate synthetase [Armatimonadota bacterium]
MRMLMEVRIPNNPFNDLVREGSAGKVLGKILDTVKPEAVYFTERYGQRGAIIILNVENPSQVPAIAEPFFLQLDAEVEFHIVMSPDDLKNAELDEIGKKWA